MSTNDRLDWKAVPKSRPRTHYEGCWRYHPECAIVKIEQLEEELEHLHSILDKYDIGVFDDNVVTVKKKKK